MRPTPFAAALTLTAFAVSTPAAAQGPRPDRTGPHSLEIVDESGAALPTFHHGGRTYVLGNLGQRYLVHVRNGSPRRAEVVVSVDGRDVIDGRPSAFEKRGYIVDAYGEITVDGYRLSEQSVAAFRFSSVPRSYAARKGDARDVGVIGVAVFPERPPVHVAPAPPWGHAPELGRGAPMDRSEAPAAEKSAGAPPPSAAPGASAMRSAPAPQRPGLGTEFAEQHESRVTQVLFERASARPATVLSVRYDDRQGLLALGIDVDRRGMAGDDAWLRESADPFRRNGSYAAPPAGWMQR
jgi:hypothetical protein